MPGPPRNPIPMSIGNDVHCDKPSGSAPEGVIAPAVRYLDSVLRGCGQVIFMDRPVSGLLNLAAMFWGAWAGGTTLAVAIGSLVGVLVATAAAYPLHGDRAALRTGLYGFNGMLLGAGIPTFLANTALMWAVLIFAAAIVTVVTLATDRVLRPWKIPGLTFPYVLTTWLVLLAARPFAALEISAPPPVVLATLPSAAGGAADLFEFVRASLVSISQVYFVDNPVSGTIFLLALAVHSRWCAVLAACGAMTAVACALLAGADPGAVSRGLWGYSAVLTAPAVGCIFMKPTPRVLVYSAAATLFSLLVQGATTALAETAGVPPLTFAFVLTTWVFLFARHPIADNAIRTW